MKISKGFTLLELLVVIAILGVLAGFVVTNIQNPLAKSRDAQRRNDLKQLQTALELYYQDYGQYPSTIGAPGCIGDWCCECSYFGSHTTDYIPNPPGKEFVPKYIRRLPNDPKASQPPPPTIPDSTGCGPQYAGYYYRSDGTDYKILSACTPETPLNNPKDAFYDPVRPYQSWQVSTDAAYNW